MSSPRKPATLACCLTGVFADRKRAVELLAASMRPGDHVFAIEGSCGPAAPPQPEPIPAGVRLVRIPAVFIGVAYDLITSNSPHDHLIFVGAGCTATEGDIERIRGRLDSIGPGAVFMTPHRTSSSLALGSRSVIGVSRQVVLGLGGMAYATYKARGMSSGLIGSGDLFEAFANEVRRAGWTTEYLTQTSRPANSFRAEPAPAAAVRTDPCATVDADDSLPPSRRIPAELRAAVAPGAALAIDWFAPFISAEQKRALSALIGRDATPSTKATAQGWDLLFFAGMLWGSGQAPYAAHLLETGDLTQFVDRARVAEIRRMLSEAGRPFSVILSKLAHAREQLAATLLDLPLDEANAALVSWWESEPGSETALSVLAQLVTRLGPADRAAWELRLTSFAQAVTAQ